MPLHPQTAALSEQMAAANEGRPAMHEISPEEARAGYRAMAKAFGPPPEVADVEDRSIPGPAGEIGVRVYTPAGDGPFPLLVFFHGGGWVIGDLDTHDRECRILCNEAGCVVMAVDYRLAPEHRFPAGHDDCWAAFVWAHAHAAELDADADRLAVCGDSAGGNLAAVVAIRARDAGIPLRLQVLVYPAVDARGGQASRTQNAEGPFLTSESIDYFNKHLFGDQDREEVVNDWRMSPLIAPSLAGLAPAYVATCELDPIRDEGDAYAAALKEAGVQVTHSQWPGQPHVLFQLSPVLDDAKALLAECAQALREAFE